MDNLDLIKQKILKMLEKELSYGYDGNEFWAYKCGYESALETLLGFIEENQK